MIKSKRKLLLIALSVLIVIAGAAAILLLRDLPNDKILRIGCVIPKSDNVDSDTLRSVNLAIDKRNLVQKEGESRYEIHVEYVSSSEELKLAYKNLLKKKVCSILCDLPDDDQNQSIAAWAQEDQIPIVLLNSANDCITSIGNFVFRANSTYTNQSRAAATFAYNKLSKKRAAILYSDNNPRSIAQAEEFSEYFTKLGGIVVKKKYIGSKDQSSMSSIAGAIRDAQPDIVYIPDDKNTASLIVKNFRAIRMTDLIVLGDYQWLDIEKISDREILRCFYIGDFFIDPTEANTASYIKEYNDRYRIAPAYEGALAYDTANILLNAIARFKDQKSSSIREALSQTNDDYLTGHIYFDKNRIASRSAMIYKLDRENEKIVSKVFETIIP